MLRTIETDSGWSAHTPAGGTVGIYIGQLDTAVLVLQRTGDRGETLTSTIPISWGALEALVKIGQMVLAKIDGPKETLPEGRSYGDRP